MYWFQVPSYPASDALGKPQSMKLRMLPSMQRETFYFNETPIFKKHHGQPYNEWSAVFPGHSQIANLTTSKNESHTAFLNAVACLQTQITSRFSGLRKALEVVQSTTAACASDRHTETLRRQLKYICEIRRYFFYLTCSQTNTELCLHEWYLQHAFDYTYCRA